MIYSVQSKKDCKEYISMNGTNIYVPSDSEENAFDIRTINHSSIEEYAICIPRARARGEDDTPVEIEDIPKVDHYELYVEEQVGTVRNRRDTFVFYKLPKSGKLVSIRLYMDGGVGFDKMFHKDIIRETDALDRRIILGFCLKYYGLLLDASYKIGHKGCKSSLETQAKWYKADNMPKRFKTGPDGSDVTRFYKDLKPYEENNLLKKIHFV